MRARLRAFVRLLVAAGACVRACVSLAANYGPPTRVTAGTSAAWLVAAGDTPPAAWSARATIAGPTTIVVACTPSGGAFRLELTPAATASLPAGRYTVTVVATLGADVVELERSTLAVDALPAEGADARHPDEIALEKALAVRSKLLDDGLAEYTVGEGGAGRMVKRKTLDEIDDAIRRLRRAIASRARGGRGRPIEVRFR